MSFTKYKTVCETKKDHCCYSCGLIISKGNLCTYGITTDPEIVGYKGKIVSGYFCASCRDINLN